MVLVYGGIAGVVLNKYNKCINSKIKLLFFFEFDILYMIGEI